MLATLVHTDSIESPPAESRLKKLRNPDAATRRELGRKRELWRAREKRGRVSQKRNRFIADSSESRRYIKELTASGKNEFSDVVESVNRRSKLRKPSRSETLPDFLIAPELRPRQTTRETTDSGSQSGSSGQSAKKKPSEKGKKKTSRAQTVALPPSEDPLIDEDLAEWMQGSWARAIGRTALCNAAILAGGPTGGLVAGVGVTAKRFSEGMEQGDDKEVAKSVAVFSSATAASAIGQAVAGSVMIGVVGASLPLAGAVAFGVGCVAGISAGVGSEYGVDELYGMDERDVTRDVAAK